MISTRRPPPIDVSRSRSKSPSRSFRPTTPRSIPTHILQPTRNALRETINVVEPIKNALHETKKVMSAYGVLVEPKTPPGTPPKLPKKILKRPMVKRLNDKL
jgi:hypothetical protein